MIYVKERIYVDNEKEAWKVAKELWGNVALETKPFEQPYCEVWSFAGGDKNECGGYIWQKIFAKDLQEAEKKAKELWGDSTKLEDTFSDGGLAIWIFDKDGRREYLFQSGTESEEILAKREINPIPLKRAWLCHGLVAEVKDIIQCPECKANFGREEFLSSRFTSYMGANEKYLVFRHQCSTCKDRFLAFVTIGEVIVDKTMEEAHLKANKEAVEKALKRGRF